MNTDSRNFIKTAVFATGMIGMGSMINSFAASKAPEKRPNVLFILADQWRAQAMGYAGDPNVKTPNFDAFARENINFTNAVTCQPISSPYRASLLTGQYTTSNGMLTNSGSLQFRPNTPTMGELFKAAGYQTAYIGKWHLYDGGLLEFIPSEHRFGFDFWRVMNCTHNYTESYYWGEEPVKMMWPGYDAFAQTDTLCSWLGEVTKTDQPFCMILSWGPPHNPYGLVSSEYKQLYDPRKLILRDNVPTNAVDKVRRELSFYYANCTALDDAFGKIIARLIELKQLDNTIVVFTADHGDMLGCHGYYMKSRPYNESVCVPMLMHCPGIKGKVVDEPMSTPDILPTLLDICGIKIPEKVEGRSFIDIMTGKKSTLGDCALVKWPITRPDYQLKEYRAIRTKQYTYVEEINGPWLMFDNQTDPFQMNNLIGKPQYASKQTELKEKLHKALKDTHDVFGDENYYLKKFNLKKGFNRNRNE